MKKLVILVWGLLSGSLSAQTMQLIIVINNNEAGRSIDRTADLNQMARFWKETAANTGVAFSMTHLSTNQFNPNSVQSACQNLTVSAQDMVIFYYSGHGANDKSSKWPVMELSGQLLRMSEIIRVLRAKNPKFLMVMSDCCNGYLNNGTLPPVQANPQDNRLYQDLFLNFKGQRIVLASASSPGEYSWSHLQQGAYWGICFREAFRRATDNSNSSANWEDLLRQGKQLAATATGAKQTAQFDIVIQADASEDD